MAANSDTKVASQKASKSYADGVATASIPKSILDVAGDLIYATGNDTPAKLPIGTAYKTLGVNAGATAPEWQDSAKSVLTAAGDILYASGANALAKLAIGTFGQVLAVNGDGNAPVWTSGFSKISSGTYTGNDASNRTISLPFTPKLVFVSFTRGSDASGINTIGWYSSNDKNGIYIQNTTISGADNNELRPLPTTNGFIVSGTNRGFLNSLNKVYTYFAIG